MSDFAGQFKSLADTLSGAAKGVLGKLDQWSFRMLVNNLKESDYDVVKEAIDQLVKERKPLSIPPLYFVSKMHPNNYARDLAAKALKEFGQDAEIETITRGKSAEDATKALIDKYGNYRS